MTRLRLEAAFDLVVVSVGSFTSRGFVLCVWLDARFGFVCCLWY